MVTTATEDSETSSPGQQQLYHVLGAPSPPMHPREVRHTDEEGGRHWASGPSPTQAFWREARSIRQKG